MLKQCLKNALIVFLFALSCKAAFAITGPLFKITSTGTGVPVKFTLCLTIKQKSNLSCQQFTAPVGPLTINTTIPNHTYHYVGIGVESGYVYTPTEGLKASAPSLTPSVSNFTPLCTAISATKACRGVLTSTSSTLIAAGSYFTHFSAFFTGNTGTSWTEATTLTGVTGNYAFNSTSCSGTLCTAAGQDDTTGLPLLYQSTDGGATWTTVTTTTNQGGFYSTSCSGTLCTAAGWDYTTGLPLLYQSTDGGANWTAVTTTSVQGSFSSTSCSGLG